MTNEYPDITKYPYVCIDTETTGLHWWEDDIFGVAIATPDGQSYYYDLRRDSNVWDYLKDIVPRCKMAVNHNMKFDHHFLNGAGIQLPDKLFCTQLAACIINEHEPSFSLENLAKKYLNVEKDTKIYRKLADIFGGVATKNVQMKNLKNAPLEMVAKYAKQDAVVALKLYEWQLKEIDKQDLHRILDLETRLYPVIIDMERKGIRVDVEEAQRASDLLTVEYDKSISDLCKKAGFDFNVNSPKHVEKFLAPQFNKELDTWFIGDEPILSTNTGKPSFGKPSMENLNNPICQQIIETKSILKTRDTFIQGAILDSERNGYVYPNINQTKGESHGTVTGRFSYDSPNMQNVPARNPAKAKILRPIFIPDDGTNWACFDYAQFEFRVMAHYLNDPKINESYATNPNTDYHQIVADMANIPRPNAKTINLGLSFGMQAGRLAKQMGLPYTVEKVLKADGSFDYLILVAGKEAEELMDNYHNAFPSIAALKQKIEAKANGRGHLVSIGGRHLRYPLVVNKWGYLSRNIYRGPAHLYQGSSADCMKMKLIELHDYFKGTEGRLVLSVHDEFNCYFPWGNNKMIKDVTEILERFDGEVTPIKLNVPIKTDFGEGDNWAQASGKGVD